VDFKTLILLFLLPSVKKVRAYKTDLTRHDISSLNSADINSLSKSNVELFHLSTWRVSREAFATLFRLPKNLKTFSYTERSGKWNSESESLEALRQTIQHASNTLEVLKLSLSDGVTPHPSPLSFYDFKSLKTLHICGWRVWGSNPSEDVVGYLPPSLENLVFQVLRFPPRKGEADLEYLKVILMRKSPTVLPRLKTIWCTYRNRNWNSIPGLALEKGVEIVPQDVVFDD
jgi:hypothetical protein